MPHKCVKPNKMNASVTTRIVGFSKNNTYAMIKLSANPFDCCGKTVYIPGAAAAGKSKGDMITIPENWKTITKTDDDGNVMKFSDGVEMLFLTF